MAPLALLLVAACTGRLEFDPRIGEASSADARGGGGNGGGAPAGGAGMGGGGAGGMMVSGYGSGGEPGTSMADARSAQDAWVAGTGGAGGAPMSGGGGDGGVVALDAAKTPVASACPQGYDVLDLVFNRKCGGCHGATAPTKNLDLITTGLGARMVNKMSTCMNRPLISSQLGAGGLPTGLLFDKLAGAVTGCGVRMPAGAPALTAVEIACVNDWAVAAINKTLGTQP